jgi:hypothetical protein
MLQSLCLGDCSLGRAAFVVASMLLAPAAASASACTDRIVALELAPSDNGASGAAADLPESVDARLHHQPTEESVAGAEGESKTRADQILARARQLDLDGKEAECLETLKALPAPPPDGQ